MTDVNTLVLKRLRVVVGPPAVSDPDDLKIYLAEYHKALGGYSADTLERGMDRVMRTNTFNAWPLPGVIVEACEAFKPSVQPVDTFKDDGPFEPKTEASRARVADMVEQMKRNIAAKQMPKPDHVDRVPLDVSRPAMERNEKRWRAAELSETSRRMTGEDRE